ncbi:hypothetical protein [Alicyclobacillus vulcanalis]|uniref:Nucleotide modification associated domain-containing protein n=1 Tax=Alicyclobacillus vulcanalis TaxID=252246 RepID=A0A1N7MRH3_9BACL|nr:hypothetical protein [Alicyclobacillus vulcanalis]SIS88737.1 hypothetical protein SAMN05421799_10657 [Alicyclobacillus vulcanalis]
MRTRAAIISELNELYREKNRLYGDSFRETLREFGVVAAIVRMMDKINRAKTLVKHVDASGEHEVIHVVTDVQCAGESFRDTLLDLANYAIMTVEWMDAHETDEGRVLEKDPQSWANAQKELEDALMSRLRNKIQP